MHQSVVIVLVFCLCACDASGHLAPSFDNPSYADSDAQYTPSRSYRIIFLVGFCVIFFPLMLMSIYACRYNYLQRQHLNALILMRQPITSIEISPRRGLDTVLVSRLPTLQFSTQGVQDHGDKAGVSKDCSCPVCLGEFQEGETLKVLPTCLHQFHGECIDMWLSSHVTCPLCRLSLVHRPEFV